jgi:hypothetical protein
MSQCPAVTPPHTARACRVHAPRRPFMARLAASSQLPAVHCCRRRLPARRPVRDIACSRPSLPEKNMQQASARAACVVSNGFLPAAAALTSTLRRSILDSQPQLPRAIAGRSCFAVRLHHVRRKACVAAPSMMYPAQQRVAHCVDDCLGMNTP